MNRQGPKPDNDNGASEVVGIILLVSMVVLAFGIVSLVLVSQPHKTQIPEISAVIENSTDPLTGQNYVYITHSGGDSLKGGQYQVFVNHIDRTSLVMGNGTLDWNVGDTLTVPLGNETPGLVQIYFQGPTESDLLVEHSLSSVIFGPTPTASSYYTITSLTSDNGGLITPLGTIFVPYDGSQGYMITTDLGYHVADVLINNASVGAVLNYTFPHVTLNQQISVAFAINSYLINATSGTTGNITPAGSTAVNYGATPTYTITPNSGYYIVDVLVNGASVGSVTTYTFPPVSANQTISATFAVNPPLSIAQLNPSSAIAGGTSFTLTINGTGYIASSTINWNGIAVPTTYISKTQLSATIPYSDIGSPGTANVTVVNPGGGISNTATFMINPRTFTITPLVSGGNGAISPSTVQTVNYGDTPTFTFTPNTGYHLSTVTVDGSPVTPTGNTYMFPAVTASHTIVATFAISTYMITPSVSGGNGAISPSTVQTVNYGDTPTFAFIPAAGYYLSVVTVDGSPVIASGNSYTFPAVTNNHNLAGTFTLNPPAVTSISPASGTTLGGTSVTITGTGFTGTTTVTFGASTATFTINSATQITAISPAGTGTVDVIVATPGGTSAKSSADQFTYAAPPSVTRISPASGTTLGGTSVTITGTGFTGTTTVTFGVSTATFTINSATQITAISPAGTGTVDVTVSTPSGTSAIVTGDKYIYIAPPVVTGISPAVGPLSGGSTVTITGTNLAGATAVKFGTTTATILTNTATSITATPPTGAVGTVDVTVTTVGGTSATSSSDQYTYEAAPTVTKISPTAGPPSGGSTVTITGTNFIGASRVKFGSIAATAFTVVSSTSITVTTPSGSAGTIDVTVTTPSGTSATSSSDQYTYEAAPTVTKISPTTGPRGGGTSVTITGTNFIGATGVKFGSTAATAFTVVSSTSITVTSPSGSAGTIDVTVTTPSGTSGISPSDHFRYT